MIALLDLLHAPFMWFFQQPPWIGYTIVGLLLFYALGMAGFILARLGIKPLWALTLLVPWVNVAALWWLALGKWPVQKKSD
jgi:hypothetical protein